VREIQASVPVDASNGLNFNIGTFTPAVSGDGGSVTVYLNGLGIANWDGFDSGGSPVPNGVYHVVLDYHSADGSVSTFAGNVAVAARLMPNQLTFELHPNHVRSGDKVEVWASFGGIGADAQSRIKVYNTADELVGKFTVSAGRGSWNTQGLSAGIYLLVLEGVQPGTGLKLHRVVKLLIEH